MDWLIRKLEDLLLPIRLYFGYKYMYDENRVIVRTWPNRLVKGPIPENEYEAMLYIASQTELPIPRLHRIYRRTTGLYIEREFIEGVSLDTIWNKLPDDEKRLYVGSIWSQLKSLRSDLHTGPPNTVVASTSGGPVKDGVFSDTAPIGPYSSITDFHDLLRDNPNKLVLPAGWETDGELQRPVLTNGGISPRNIIVRRQSDPHSLCFWGWEMSGWWPAYWERVKWHFCDFPPGEMKGWVEMMDGVSGMPDAN